MKQLALSQFNLPWIPITGLLIFVICFALYTYWTYKTENKEGYEEAAQIPLQEPSKRNLNE